MCMINDGALILEPFQEELDMSFKLGSKPKDQP